MECTILKDLPLGTKIKMGKSSMLEITQIGKECHSPSEIGRTIGNCIMPTEGIFCKVLVDAKIMVGDKLKVK